ncbi:unnamed protein product [Closterium sp. NIES-53]
MLLPPLPPQLTVRPADSATCSQRLTRDATARLAIRNHLPLTECAHFRQHRTAQALYDAVVARYSSPATTTLGRLLLPYLFPELSAFAIVEDLVSHLRTSDARYHAAAPAEDHFLSLDPIVLTIDLLEQHLLAAETSVVAVGAARGNPRTPFFDGCSPSPLAPSYASAAAVKVPSAEDVGATSASVKRCSSKGNGGMGGGGGSGSGGGGSNGGSGGSGGGGGGSGGSGGGSGGFGGGGGGSGGSAGSSSGGSGGGRTGAQRGGSGGGQRQRQQHRSKTPSPQQLLLRVTITCVCRLTQTGLMCLTLRTTLAALGFAPSTADPSLFLRTDTSLPPFYVLVYVDKLVFATANTEALALVKLELQKRDTCTDLGPSTLWLPVLLAIAHSSVY